MTLWYAIPIIIAGLVESFFKPRFDFCEEGVFLWYGKGKRKYVKL